MSGQENQQSVASQVGYSHTVDDEIDLRELANILIDGWYWVVGSVLLAAVLGLYIALSSERLYETAFNAVPVSSDHFQSLNELPGLSLTPTPVFIEFANRLNSFQNYSRLVEQHPELFNGEHDGSPLSHFNDKFSVNVTTGDAARLTLAYSYTSEVDGPAVANRYIDLTAQGLWEDYLQRFKMRTDSAIARYGNNIETQRLSILGEREERLFELAQAVSIARALGIETPTTPESYGRQPAGSEVIYASINSDGGLPLYFMGYRALEAEQKVIEESLDSGLLNQAIRILQQELELRQQLLNLIGDGELDRYIGMSSTPYPERLVDVLDYALESQDPSGTSRSLIMIISVMVGGMFGLVLTFLVKFAGSVLNYRREKAKS